MWPRTEVPRAPPSTMIRSRQSLAAHQISNAPPCGAIVRPAKHPNLQQGISRQMMPRPALERALCWTNRQSQQHRSTLLFERFGLRMVEQIDPCSPITGRFSLDNPWLETSVFDCRSIDAWGASSTYESGNKAMSGKPVAKRLVFHIGGYDPITSHASAQRRFVREIARFQRTWSVKATVDGSHDSADQIQWNVTTIGPDWLVETDYRLVRWHDVIEVFGGRSIGSRISVGILAFLDFVLTGTLWRYLQTNWRYAGFFLYPFVMFGLLIAAAFLIGVFAFKITGSIPIATGGGLFGFAAVLAGPWRWLHLGDLFDDWIFSREYIRRGNSEIEQRLDRLATELVAAARNFAADEILVIGHSLGAVLAVDLLDRALKLDPALGRNKIPVTFLSVGSSILKVGLHPKAIRFRTTMERVAKSRAIFWGDYQALIDPLNFYKSRPMADMGLSTENEATVRVVKLSRMLDHDMYRRIRLNFFRVHCTSVRGNHRRTSYDYFMLTCGPNAHMRTYFSQIPDARSGWRRVDDR